MTPGRYLGIVSEIVTARARCGCCDVPVNECTWWQRIRMTVDPTPTEAARLDARRKDSSDGP